VINIPCLILIFFKEDTSLFVAIMYKEANNVIALTTTDKNHLIEFYKIMRAKGKTSA